VASVAELELDPRAAQAGGAVVNRTLALIALACALVAAAITVYVVGHPFIPEDAAIERDVQATQWGPLALTFPIFTWIGDAKGFVFEVIVFGAILIWNRRAWLIAAGCALTGVWYVVISHAVLRARPTTAQVLQVTEHPGASSFPSGHTMFIVTLTSILMLCLGQRYLPKWGRVIGWALAALIVLANCIARVYTGAHWPTDVLAGALIATAWICFWVSLKWVSERALGRERATRRLPMPGSA
jgi:undecaprenyl-diphosphatase